MKPYAIIPIVECGEALTSIPHSRFPRITPHPYLSLNAPYHGKSPYYVRAQVLHLLSQAQDYLEQTMPGWKLCIFDAYRPITVQQFMVDYTFDQLLAERQLQRSTLLPRQQQALWQEVYQFWAIPSSDPSTPPPHSTGAAIDLTLIDECSRIVDMGSPIDEVSPRSFPNYFDHSSKYAQQWAVDPPLAQQFHHHRQLLNRVMTKAGFKRHPQEWWHFSYGDQLWAWLMNKQRMDTMLVARYGAA